MSRYCPSAFPSIMGVEESNCAQDVGLDHVGATEHDMLQKLADELSETMPFVPTVPHNAQQRAARIIMNVCEAMLDLHQDKKNRWEEVACKHYQRAAKTEWDKAEGSMSAILPSTSGLSMMGNMKLKLTRDDWPPYAEAASQPRFQFVWTHFPEAKGRWYSSHDDKQPNPRQLYTPVQETLDRFEEDIEVQIGFTMDIMIAARDEVATNATAKGNYVAMVFNPVGAGAFVDALSSEEQTLCLERIMRAMVAALTKRASQKCVLFVSGQMGSDGKLKWTNKMGNVALVEVVPEVRECLVAGSFDCLALAQKLASSRLFCHVGLAMAADKHRIGNAWLSIRRNRDKQLEFAAWNASDENNTRRSSLMPWVLQANAPRFDWRRITPAAVVSLTVTLHAAEQFLCRPHENSYVEMMSSFSKLLADDLAFFFHDSMKIAVPRLQFGTGTGMVRDLH
eukprot:TRINITY_DN1790_c0_g2_i1.p1 TRINITY_DN1790_c0_g2~~TRINITY_DN1790_c0_g2_i1.p1  ORF type:complete len:451 (+),score=71.36 TRINITY_DN1790_c0_g2_i1:29-1381(+)